MKLSDFSVIIYISEVKKYYVNSADKRKEPLIMEENFNIKENEVGNVTISDEVVSVIAGVATSEVKGVASMSGSLAGGIAEMLGKKNAGKGVKVDIEGNSAVIDLHIIVIYGSKVPEVAWEIQEKVKKAVESMTGLNVEKVNIYIEGVVIEKENKKEAKPAKVEEAEAEADENQ